MSKATKRHCASTVQSQGGRVGNVEQVAFELGPQDSHGRCGSDKIRQTVPDVSSGDWKSSVTDGRQSGAADNQWRRWTGTKSLTSLDIICHLTKLVSKVCRCRPVKTLVHEDCIMHIECHLIWSGAFSQCSWRRSGVMCWMCYINWQSSLLPVL